MTTTTHRKWTAIVTVGGEDFDAPEPANDTLTAQYAAAVGVAASFIRDGMGRDAWVTLYKTTRTGTTRDRAFHVDLDDDGALRVQR